jgi:adenosylcobinamide kinase/adenosylcobinamide-phosphate guanylyltransferase
VSDTAHIALVLGGARSGKSAVAERLVAAAGLPVTYIATATAGDAEMQARIARHRARRPAEWTTVEAPYDVTAALRGDSPRAYQIDSQNVYLSNWLLALEQQGLGAEEQERECLAKVDALIAAMRRVQGWVVVVGNEVGQGVVPPYPLGRTFRDVAGWANQRVAVVAHEVYLCVAGIPVELKRLQSAPASGGMPAAPIGE